MSRICVSMGNADYGGISELTRDFGFFEFRLDLIRPEAEFYEQIKSMNLSWIASAGTEVFDADRQINMLENAISANAGYIDIPEKINFPDKQDLSRKARENGCRIIHSYHNFSETPIFENLRRIAEDLMKIRPDMIKIACQANSMADVSRMISLYDRLDNIVRNNNLISISIGDKGKISRVASASFGSAIIYCSANDDDATAEGQIPAKKMRELIKNYRL